MTSEPSNDPTVELHELRQENAALRLEIAQRKVLADCVQGYRTASSLSEMFGAGHLFGRDPLFVAWDLAEGMDRQLFSLLPQWQGHRSDPLTEEQPDRLPHQVFRTQVQGHLVGQQQVADAKHWAGVWGLLGEDPAATRTDDFDGFAVYNATDTTALYLPVLAQYVQLHGPDVLRDRYRHRATGQIRTVEQAGGRCADWIAATIAASSRGLFEVAATNPRQTSPSGVRRDGSDAYFHPVPPLGAHPNRERPVAYLAEQGRAVEALAAAVTLLPDHPHRTTWEQASAGMGQKVWQHYWMPQQQFLACAVDYHPQTGQSRQVPLHSLEALEVLQTRLFDGLTVEGRDVGREVVSGVVQAVCDPTWMTPAGPTMLHPRDRHFEGAYLTYQGSGTIWPTVIGSCVRALDHQHLGPVGTWLATRLLETLRASGAAPEFYFIDRENPDCPSGAVILDPVAASQRTQGRRVPSSPLPQQHQAWSASAALWMLHRDPTTAPPEPGTWQAELCQQAQGQLAHVPPLLPHQQPEVILDTTLGLEGYHALCRARDSYDSSSF